MLQGQQPCPRKLLTTCLCLKQSSALNRNGFLLGIKDDILLDRPRHQPCSFYSSWAHHTRIPKDMYLRQAPRSTCGNCLIILSNLSRRLSLREYVLALFIIHFHLSLSASTICFGLNTRYGIMCKQFPVVTLRRVVQICALYVVLLADSIFCTEISDLVQTSAGKITGCSDMRPRI